MRRTGHRKSSTKQICGCVALGKGGVVGVPAAVASPSTELYQAAISQRVESAQLAEALQRRLDETTSKSSQDLSSIEAQQSAAAVWLPSSRAAL